MRFGGHQTFSIRDGWLYKGLQALIEAPDEFKTEPLRDRLGVGKNMARSIQHWVRATGLAEADGKGRWAKLRVSELGQMIWEYDRYFLHPGTWWVLHARLVSSPSHAYSWAWFFNHFTHRRFERAVALEGLRRHLLAEGSRMPSLRTLERDLACLLRTYSRQLPRVEADPEDNLECPMGELGLMTHSRQSGFFHLHQGRKEIPFSIFGWVVSRRFASSDEREALDVSLTELAYEANGPGRVFSLSAEELFDLVQLYERAQQGRILLTNQAGERVIRLSSQAEEEWLEEYFSGLPDESLVLRDGQAA